MGVALSEEPTWETVYSMKKLLYNCKCAKGVSCSNVSNLVGKYKAFLNENLSMYKLLDLQSLLSDAGITN